MAKIEDSIAYVLENEGGWTIDDGGWTMWGITVPDVAAYRHVSESSITEQEMKNLTKAEATDIYKALYWDKMKLDDITDQNMATCIFDTGVNRGISVGVKYAQKVATILGNPCTIDSQAGPQTTAAVNKCVQHNFITSYEALVMAAYEAIVNSNPSKYGIYLKGWESRARRLLTLV